MNSALYSGWVGHRRFAPRAHDFRYRMGLLYLDLDEQEQYSAYRPWPDAAVGRLSVSAKSTTCRSSPAAACA